MAGPGRPGPSARPLGEVYLRVERTPVMRLSRTLDNRSWEAGAYGAIYRANLRIVRAVQEKAAANLAATIVRPAQRTGRLEQTIRDSGAVYADGQRMIVGVAEFMDRKARYWRPVEEGAPGLIGMRFYGYWSNSMRTDKGRLAKGSLHRPMGGVNTGRPIIVSVNTPPPGYLAGFMRGNFGPRPFTWTIEHPTQAHWFFLNAWNQIGQSGFPERAYREEFRRATGPNGKPINLPASFRALHGRPLARPDFRF